MVNFNKEKDRNNLLKYIDVLADLIANKISVDDFEKSFLHMRRTDEYLMSGSFSTDIESLLGSLFLDVDAYNPDDLYDPNDKYNINEIELRRKVSEYLLKFKEFVR